MKAMKGRAKAAMSLLQDLHVLHGEKLRFIFTSNHTCFQSPPLKKEGRIYTLWRSFMAAHSVFFQTNKQDKYK